MKMVFMLTGVHEADADGDAGAVQSQRLRRWASVPPMREEKDGHLQEESRARKCRIKIDSDTSQAKVRRGTFESQVSNVLVSGLIRSSLNNAWYTLSSEAHEKTRCASQDKILFILDGSGSVKDSGFAALKELLASVVARVPQSPFCRETDASRNETQNGYPESDHTALQCAVIFGTAT